MSGSIRVLPTRYENHLFRSRLEARWAVFFDALDIAWEYEPEGYVMSDGTCYLPDFWLPTFGGGMFVEVKRTGGDMTKPKKFAQESRMCVWLAEGPPATRSWWYGTPATAEELSAAGLTLDDIHDDDCWTTGIPNADQAYRENRMFSSPGYDNEDMSVPAEYYCALGDHYLAAVYKAVSERFGT